MFISIHKQFRCNQWNWYTQTHACINIHMHTHTQTTDMYKGKIFINQHRFSSLRNMDTDKQATTIPLLLSTGTVKDSALDNRRTSDELPL